MRLRTTRQPSWASAQRRRRPPADDRRTVLEGDLVGAEVLEPGEREDRAGADLDLGRAGEEGLRLDRRPKPSVRSHLLLDDGRLRVVADRDDRPREHCAVRGARRPSAGRSAAPDERRPGREVQPVRSRGPASSARACRSRAARSRPRGGGAAGPGRGRSARPSVSRTTPAARASGESTSAGDAVLARSRRTRPLLRGAAPRRSRPAPHRRAVRRTAARPRDAALRRSTYVV